MSAADKLNALAEPDAPVLRVVALQVSKRDGLATINSMTQHWGYFRSDEEAVGHAMARLHDMKPGFSVDQYLVCRPDAPPAQEIEHG